MFINEEVNGYSKLKQEKICRMIMDIKVVLLNLWKIQIIMQGNK